MCEQRAVLVAVKFVVKIAANKVIESGRSNVDKAMNRLVFSRRITPQLECHQILSQLLGALENERSCRSRCQLGLACRIGMMVLAELALGQD